MYDESDDNASVDDEDYYAFLNVSRTATIEEINTAYKYLSRIYHPDKHVDLAKKKDAELLFNRTKRAYEVLQDAHKRAIYDSLGQKGLETEGWELVTRQRTPLEIRAEYEELARKKEERRLLKRTNPRGHISIGIDATEILSTYVDEFDEKLFPAVSVSGMSMAQSMECPLTSRDTVTMSGNLSSQNGRGSGNFVVSGRRLVNKGTMEMELGVGNAPTIGLKGSRTLSDKVYCNVGLNVAFQSNVIVPILAGTLACQLNKNTVGYLTYTTGAQSSMSTVLEQSNEKHHWQMSILIGIPHCYVSASYLRKLPEYELKLRVATKAGTFGFTTEYGAEKKVSKYSSVSATVSMGVPSGVYLKLKVIRSTQTFIFPIHISEEIVPAAVFYATTTPILVWLLVKKVIVDPMNADQKRRTLEKTREVNKQRMAERKREAEASVDLMSAANERSREEEQRRRGLIIERATYGQLSNSDDTEAAQIDVTVPLQCLVKGSKLLITVENKSELPGFYDPCVGEDKQLRIEYTFRDQKFEVTVKDEEPVRIPTAADVQVASRRSSSSNGSPSSSEELRTPPSVNGSDESTSETVNGFA